MRRLVFALPLFVVLCAGCLPEPGPAVATPTITPPGGTFTGAIQLTLACNTMGAVIRYTTDGSTPSATSKQYTAPFMLTRSATVKAKAYKSGYADSGSASATFTLMGSGPGSGSGAGTWTYYVAENSAGASDFNPGSETRPWLTLTRAANTVLAGGTVLIKAGTYREPLILRSSGAPGAMITFKAYPGDGVVQSPDYRVRPTSGVRLTGGVYINQKRYVRIEGLEITGTTGDGVFCQDHGGGGVSTIELVNNYIHDVGATGNEHAIEARGVHDCLFERNYTRDIHGSGITTRTDARFATNVMIRGNVILHTDCDGMRLSGTNVVAENNVLGSSFETDCHQDAFEIYGYNDGLTIRNNLIFDYTQGVYLSSEDGLAIRNVDVIGNVVWCDQYCAKGRDLSAVNAGGNNAPLKNIRIEGNTFWNAWVYVADSYAQDPAYKVNSLVIRNNIFAGAAGRRGVDLAVDPSAIVEDYNLYFGTPYSGFTPGRHSLIDLDPQFVDPGTFDLHLLPASPAVNSGTSVLGLSADPDGVARPQGGGWDMGAYEVPQ